MATKISGGVGHVCPYREPLSIWCRAHPSPFPADLEIKPGRGRRTRFTFQHLLYSGSLAERLICCHQTTCEPLLTLVKYSESFRTIFDLENAGTNIPHP